MVIRLRLLICSALLLTQLANAETGRVGFLSAASSDSDDTNQRKYLLFYRQNVLDNSYLSTFSLESGKWFLDDNVRQANFNVATVRASNKITGIGTFNIYDTKLNSNYWSPNLIGAEYVYDLSEKWRGELFGNRDVVDTVSAIEHEYVADTYGGSADYYFTKEWSAVAQLYTQEFSDENKKLGRIFGFSYSPSAMEGLSVRAKAKKVTSNFEGIGYFSPEKLEQYTLSMIYADTVLRDRWRYEVRAETGTEAINNDIRNKLYKLEFRLRGWFNNDFGAEGKLGCSNVGGGNSDNANRSSDNYEYCYAEWSIFKAW